METASFSIVDKVTYEVIVPLLNAYTMEVKSCKHVSSFDHVIKIKLTRPASEQVAGAAVERLILGSRTIALSR